MAAGSEQSRKSSSASSLDTSREGRDRRRRNRKKIPRRQNSKSQRNDEPLKGVTSSSGVVVVNNSVTTLNDSSSISYFKTSPVIVAFPISEELESSTASPPASFQMSFRSPDQKIESNSNVFQVEMMSAEGVDKISFIDSSNCCTLKIDNISW